MWQYLWEVYHLTSLLKRWVSTCKLSHIVSCAAGIGDRGKVPWTLSMWELQREGEQQWHVPSQTSSDEWESTLPWGCTVDCLGFEGSLRLDTFLVDSYEHSFRCLGSAGSPEAFSLLYGQQQDPGKFLPAQLLSSYCQPTEKGCYSFPLTVPLQCFWTVIFLWIETQH